MYERKDNRLCCQLQPETFAAHSEAFTAAARYVCVFLLDKKNKYAYVYGSGAFEGPTGKKFISTHVGAHKEAITKAFEGNEISYQWLQKGDKPKLYQTFLYPLADYNGAANHILGLVKILDYIAAPGMSTTVAEGPGQSFVRLVINAREKEKRRVSSSLHDELGTAAVVINSLLAILKEDIKDGKIPAAMEDIDKISDAFGNSAARIKKVIVDLRPPQIEEIGLNAAVKNLVDTLSGTVPLNMDYIYNIGDNVKMSEAVKITLYRVVQEAINNTLKHAKATKIKINFSESKSNILLDIKDDGIGYVDAHIGVGDKLGILGMKENVSYIGGTMEINGINGKGTVIKVTCPKITYVRTV